MAVELLILATIVFNPHAAATPAEEFAPPPAPPPAALPSDDYPALDLEPLEPQPEEDPAETAETGPGDPEGAADRSDAEVSEADESDAEEPEADDPDVEEGNEEDEPAPRDEAQPAGASAEDPSPDAESPAPESPAPESPAPESPAPESPAPETPAPETPAPEPPPLVPEDDPMAELMADPQEASFDEGAAARPIAAMKLNGSSPTVLSLRTHAKVAGDYVRIMDLAAFVQDPDNIEPFIETIIVCPAPTIDAFTSISRASIADRLKQFGVPLDRIVMTGAREVLVLRIRAHATDTSEGEDGDRATSGGAAAVSGGERAVTKGSAILIVRSGELINMEEQGTALSDGTVGETIQVKDRKGRTLRATVVRANTVAPVNDQP